MTQEEADAHASAHAPIAFPARATVQVRPEFEANYTPAGAVDASHYRAIREDGTMDEKGTDWRPPIFLRTADLPFR